jgi:Lipoproteins
MPLGNVVFIENAATGKGIYVRINDRISDNGIKLSRKAFDMLEFSSINQAEVVVYLDQ